jgi:hypothetical protein
MIYLHLSTGNIVPLDGVMKDSHSAISQITQFPLEDGSFVNDHTILKPKTLNISTGVMKSDNPSEMYSTMVALRDERVLMDIQTHLELYENFLLESVEPVRDAGVGDLIMISLKFQEVKFAKSKQIKIESRTLSSDDAKNKLVSSNKRGEVAHKESVTVDGKKNFELDLTDEPRQSVSVNKFDVDVGYNSLLSTWFVGVGEGGERRFNGIKATPNKNLVEFMGEDKSLVAVTKKEEINREDLKDSKVIYTPDTKDV